MAVKKIFLFKNFIITIPISNHRRISRNIDFDQNGGVPKKKSRFLWKILHFRVAQKSKFFIQNR